MVIQRVTCCSIFLGLLLIDQNDWLWPSWDGSSKLVCRICFTNVRWPISLITRQLSINLSKTDVRKKRKPDFVVLWIVQLLTFPVLAFVRGISTIFDDLSTYQMIGKKKKSESEPTTVRDLVGCSNYWVTEDSMASKGENWVFDLWWTNFFKIDQESEM